MNQSKLESQDNIGLTWKLNKGSLQKKKNCEDSDIVPIRWEGGQSKSL